MNQKFLLLLLRKLYFKLFEATSFLIKQKGESQNGCYKKKSKPNFPKNQYLLPLSPSFGSCDYHRERKWEVSSLSSLIVVMYFVLFFMEIVFWVFCDLEKFPVPTGRVTTAHCTPDKRFPKFTLCYPDQSHNAGGGKVEIFHMLMRIVFDEQF